MTIFRQVRWKYLPFSDFEFVELAEWTFVLFIEAHWLWLYDWFVRLCLGTRGWTSCGNRC
jgi:hypothetical protein